MAKVTSKLQVTVPKALAAELEIQPGDEVDWAVSGNGLRVTPSRDRRQNLDLATRLRQRSLRRGWGLVRLLFLLRLGLALVDQVLEHRRYPLARPPQLTDQLPQRAAVLRHPRWPQHQQRHDQHDQQLQPAHAHDVHDVPPAAASALHPAHGVDSEGGRHRAASRTATPYSDSMLVTVHSGRPMTFA